MKKSKKPSNNKPSPTLRNSHIIPNLNRFVKSTLCLTLVLLLSNPFSPTPILALTEDEVEKFSQNNIIFYDPSSGSSWGCTGSNTPTTGNTDHAGNTILNDTQLAAITENQPTYEKVGNDYGIPWAVFAVIHLRESGLARNNPSNRLGIYQITDGVHYYEPTSSPVSDAEFERQTRDAADHLQGKINANNLSSGLAAGEPDAVKKLFFAYNGMAGVYVTQALNLGFSSEEASNGEGSPYVMNRADARRDPTVEPTKSNRTWGQIKRDYGSIEYPANSDYGAFVVYASLAGLSIGCGMTEGGMTEDQARRFMMRYGENINNDSVTAMNASPFGTPGSGCAGGALSNCVSFSAFFMNKFSDTLHRGGNGSDVVANLSAAGVPTGSEPQVYSVFSWDNGGYGHTGVVLGIHGDTIIVGHASCSGRGTGAGDGTSSGGGAGFIFIGKADDSFVWFGQVPTEFAYLENVDTDELTRYINNGP